MTIYEMIPNYLYVSGSLNQADWEFVNQKIKVVVNLRTEPDRPPFGSPHITYYWFPMTILVAPTVQWTAQFSEFINDLIDSGHPVLMHDRLGIQRLGYAIIAVYMKRFRLTLKQAFMEVRKVKANIQPTPNYLEVLMEYERYLQL
jgi:protein-tyrosine phosphatase